MGKSFCIIFLLLLLILNGCKGSSNPSAPTEKPKSELASELHSQGLKLYYERKYKEALEVWEKELGLTPNNPNTLNNIGIANNSLGDRDKAVEYYKKAIEIDPNFGHAYYNLGLVSHHGRDFEQAIKFFSDAIRLNYANEYSYYWLGQSYQKLNRCEEAIKAYEKVIELRPSRPYVHYQLGEMYSSVRKYDLAIKEFKKEVEINPSQAYWSRIRILEAEIKRDPNNADNFFELKKYKEAIEIWENELKHIPNNPITLNKIGMAYRGLGNREKAIEYHKKATELDPHFGQAHYGLGLAYYDRKDFEQATKLFLEAIRLNYADADVYFDLGRSYQKLSRYEEAIKSYDKVIESKPSYPWVHYRLGKCYSSVGKYDLAIKEFNAAIEMNPSETYQSRIGILETETKRDPDSPDKLFALGVLYKGYPMDEFIDEAINVFQRAVKLKLSYPDVHFQLGQLYEKKGEKSKAKDEYIKELKFNPTSQTALRSLGELQQKWEYEVDTSAFLDERSAFAGISFPQKGIIAIEKAGIYDGPLFLNKIGELRGGDQVNIKGISERCLADKDGRLEMFYSLENRKGCIRTKDVILKSKHKNPDYVSPNKKIQIIINPISSVQDVGWINYFFLWLKLETGKLKFLVEYTNRYCMEKGPGVKWSDDERYFFAEGKVFSSNGVLIYSFKDIYHSPYWHNDLLFIRGVDTDDAVYCFNVKTKEFKKLLDIPEGGKEPGFECNAVWEPIRLEGKFIKAVFGRFDDKSPGGWVEIEVTADMNGKIIKKQVKRRE